jgi:hypothetical protein
MNYCCESCLMSRNSETNPIVIVEVFIKKSSNDLTLNESLLFEGFNTLLLKHLSIKI